MESNRFQTHYDFPSETLVLEISDIWPHDSGKTNKQRCRIN